MIINCANYGEINVAESSGIANRGKIYNCYNIGNITSYNDLGYSAGIGYNAIVKNSYNLGNITGSDKYAISKEEIDASCYNLSGSETEEQNNNVLSLLNKNREDINSWSEWKIDKNLNNGYPVFEWQ